MGSLPEASHAVRVFVAGGSYAGLGLVANLLDLSNGLDPRASSEPYPHHPNLNKVDIEITLADERDGFYHLIGSPLALADSEFAKKFWVKFSDIPGIRFPNVKVLHGTVSKVDCAAKTATVTDSVTKEPTIHRYDYFVAASGLRRVWPVVPQSPTRKQYLLEVEEQIHVVDTAKHGVVVVGGGAVGIEMAAELKMVKPHVQVTLVHSRDKLLSSEGLPDEVKDLSLTLLRENGVEVLMNHRVATTKKLETTDGLPKYEIEFTNGKKLTASEVVMAISKSIPTSTYLPSSAVDEEGYVKVNSDLTFVEGTPNRQFHFASGDITKWPGIKRAGAAMHHGHHAAMNIHQSIIQQRTGKPAEWMTISRPPPVIGLAVGKSAIAYSPGGGLTHGEDVQHAYFRGDLGWQICWDHMGLDGPNAQEVKSES
ncbi:hypothetical protein BGZ63DRAFT_364601 [Mariannaea sp. PMI_226]|nr:hypothetical protein BGZ63DRAFT_364601 [Mariannaea sp. PMI_226]